MCAMLFSSLSRQDFAMKEESMPQTVPVSPTTCDYSHFAADSFDLSLLGSPADGEVPYSPTSIHQLLARFSDGPCSPPLMFHSPPHVKEEPLPFKEDEDDDEEARVVDQQLLREVLRDMSFQRRLNVRPFDLDALAQEAARQEPISTLEHEQMQPVLSLAIEQLRHDMEDACNELGIASATATSPVHMYHSPARVKEEPLPPKEDLEQEAGARAGDHQLLREVLRDTSFQRRHNVRPLDLDALAQEAAQQEPLYTVGHEQIEPVLSLAIQQLRQDVDDTCSMLGIASDPSQWTVDDVKAWLLWTLRQYNLPMIPMEYFAVDGAVLSALTEQEFQHRSPQCGSMLYAQLEIWKAACQELESRLDSNPWSNTTVAPNSCSSGDMSEDEEEESVAAPSPPAPTSCSGGSTAPGSKVARGASHIHLWQFLKELLASPQLHGSCIRWLERNKGVFKIEDSVRVARLWGKRKNRPAMNYDKLSRSIRQYYKKGIMKKTERSQRLVYQFCHPYCL